MKKLLLPLVAVLAFGCSSDKDESPQIVLPPSTNTLKATINGTAYTFDKIIVETQTITDEGYTYVDLHVTASINGDETRSIEFNCEQNVAGTESTYWFYAYHDFDFDYDYEETDVTFANNITINSDRRLVGTFSGTLDNYENTEQITITNGSYDLTY